MTLPTYQHHVAGQVWVKLDPRDRLAGLHPTYLSNPDEFTPRPSIHTHKLETWGIPEGDIDENDPSPMPAYFMRQMEVQMMYMSMGNPQTQFIEILLDRKLAALAERGEGDRAGRDYVLKITMPEILNKDGEEMVWRRLKVSGGMKLSVFQDKVLQPAMGWVRNYHGYIFTDRSDGAQFGPEDAEHVDMMHIYLNGHLYIPDKDHTIANVLPAEGSALGYKYDLGDRWIHEIVVEEILPKENSTGRVELIDGAGACPAEDHDGNYSWNELLPKIYSGDPETHREINRSLNYRNQRSSWRMDPEKFDLGAGRFAIREALASKASEPSGPKKSVFPMSPGVDLGQPEGMNMLYGRAKRGTVHTATAHPEMGNSAIMTETVRERPDSKKEALCDNCGKPDGLKRCAGCAGVWYCSRECQVFRWRSHKPSCGSRTGSTTGSTST